jgi:Zn-dependent protease with chaperone function
MNVSAYWFSDKIALARVGAKPADEEQYKELHRIVENLAITAGLPKPRVYIIEDPQPNAFATGRDKNHAVIAVTTGLLAMMNKSELEGVIAHELSHVGNRDILVMTVAVVLVGVISVLANIAIRMSFWGGGDRERNNTPSSSSRSLPRSSLLPSPHSSSSSRSRASASSSPTPRAHFSRAIPKASNPLCRRSVRIKHRWLAPRRRPRTSSSRIPSARTRQEPGCRSFFPRTRR